MYPLFSAAKFLAKEKKKKKKKKKRFLREREERVLGASWQSPAQLACGRAVTGTLLNPRP